jgi:Ca2+-binding RTX toxin-like protein
MPILTVGPTSTYASITDAMVDAVAGDTISLESGYSNESAIIALNNIIVDGDATSTGIILQLGSGIATFTLIGDAPIQITDGPDGNGIVGNAGDNIITVSSGVDAVDGGAGTDRLIVDYQAATGSVTGNSTSDFTEAGGGGRSVTITNGTIENFTIFTGAQADTLTTGDGDDYILAGDGANTVTAGDGDNTLLGGADADTFTVGDGNNSITAGDGANTVNAGQGVNTIIGGNDSDLITALNGGNIIDGGDGTNVLTSGDGDDTITSGNGAATIVAGGGTDLITLQGGASTVDAGLGNDTLVIDYAAMLTDMTGGITGGNLLTGYTGHVEDSAANSVDFVGTENLVIRGGIGNDALVTGDGIDVMEGNDGNDTLTSGNGDDKFTGGAGDDELNGGDGIDTAFYSGAWSDYTVTFDLDGKPTQVVDNRPGSPEGTDTLTGIEMADFALNSVPTGSVIITGTPTEDQVLTASNTLADADGVGTVTYQWQADGTNIAGATDATLTLAQAQVGSTITVVASYTDNLLTAESITSAATAAVANVNDVPTGLVTITGTPAEGEILTAANTLADEDGLGTVTYQWQADGVAIAGATSSSFTLTQNQVGRAITALASYTDQQGTPEAVGSAATTAVANLNEFPTGSVIITGTPTEDQVLTASNTLADADGMGTVTYQWQAGGVAIAGATNSSFTLTQNQVGAAITVLASYTDQQGTSEAVGSAATAAVANLNDLPIGAVTISGTPTEDQILTASNTLADEDGLGTVTYQWQAGGVAIAGATGSSFTLTQNQVGAAITVLASYSDQQGTPEAVGSAATTAVESNLPSFQFTMTDTGFASQVEAMRYSGPVSYLNYEFAGTVDGEAVLGTTANDFMHLGASDDAADGGDGDDVVDGGTGSNFLSGGAGMDVFFLDGRNGETTWSTITDWQAGEQLVLWGWSPGVSQATWLADDGTAGYRGVTMHADLDSNGVIDTSVTWTGMAQSDLPTPTEQDGLLWFA